eukprot:3521903-Lingulodinium_polyedra.AAC.1
MAAAAAGAAVAAIWLGTYPDGAFRNDQKSRTRFALPAPAWLQERLDAVGGPGRAQACLRHLGGGYDKDRNTARPVAKMRALLR